VQVRFSRRFFLTLIAALCAAVPAVVADVPTSDVRMLMMEEPGCRYCAAWDADVGRGYAATAEGQFAPLQRVRRGAPELATLAKPATYTPTFIIMKGTNEVGRITGYPGQFYFWEELKEILISAGFTSNAP
jgi:hypothetical protein